MVDNSRVLDIAVMAGSGRSNKTPRPGFSRLPSGLPPMIAGLALAILEVDKVEAVTAGNNPARDGYKTSHYFPVAKITAAVASARGLASNLVVKEVKAPKA